MKIAAKIISYVFHPLIIPIFGLLIIFNTDSYINYSLSFENKAILLLLISVLIVVLPLLISMLLLFTKNIKSLEMETQKERIIPYSFTIIFYIALLYKLQEIQIALIIFKFIKGATFSIMIAFAINTKWKVSAHMIALGGLTGALFCISTLLGLYITPYLILSLFVAGLIGSARLILKAHTPSQIYVGFAIGVICQLIVFYF